LSVVGIRDVAVRLSSPASLIVRSRANEVWVNYSVPQGQEGDRSGNHLVSTLEIYDATSLEKKTTLTESVNADDFMLLRRKLGNAFSPSARYFAADDAVYESLWRVRMVDGKPRREDFPSVLTQLSPAQTAQLEPLRQADPASGQKVLPLAFGPEAAGLLVASIPDPGQRRTLVTTFRFDGGGASPLVSVPLDVVLHLTPDARRLVVEEVDRRVLQPGEGPVAVSKGRFTVLALPSGEKVSEFSSADAAGPRGRVLCMPDARRMFYGNGQRILAFDLDRGAELGRVESTFPVDEWTQCVFADR
jgi:hypothetical protein